MDTQIFAKLGLIHGSVIEQLSAWTVMQLVEHEGKLSYPTAMVTVMMCKL